MQRAKLYRTNVVKCNKISALHDLLALLFLTSSKQDKNMLTFGIMKMRNTKRNTLCKQSKIFHKSYFPVFFCCKWPKISVQLSQWFKTGECGMNFLIGQTPLMGWHLLIQPPKQSSWVFCSSSEQSPFRKKALGFLVLLTLSPVRPPGNMEQLKLNQKMDWLYLARLPKHCLHEANGFNIASVIRIFYR